MRRVLWALTSCAVLLACTGTATTRAPRGQIVLYVTTDAPLPMAPGEEPEPNAPPPLFDRLRIDLFAPSATEPCADCSRDFELDRVRVRDGKASIGVVPLPGVSGYVARARLFRFISLEGGEPPALSTLDVYAALPRVERDGVVKATITLRVDDVGTTLGSLTDPVATAAGEPNFSQLGTWPRAERVPCFGSTRPGEVCVPGGAFWLGHPYSGYHAEGAESNVSRLVTLSPFFVDLHEVTVAEFRAAGLPVLEAGNSVDPWSGPAPTPPAAALLTPRDEQYFCTYSDTPLTGSLSREDLPLNCISWATASAYCAVQGKLLPSEAEYEYLAGGLRSDLFVWGSDIPRPDSSGCAYSVWGRGGFLPGQFGANAVCRPDGDLGGALTSGSRTQDRLPLNGQEVLDLMGNVSEWTRDAWNRITEPCWAGRALLANPQCSTPGVADASATGPLHTVKGQSWAGLVYPTAFRLGGAPQDPARGFRCVRPGH